MANLGHGQTNITQAPSWELSTTQNNQTATYHFDTGNKYVDQDIDLKVSAKSAVIKKGTDTVSPGWNSNVSYGESISITAGWTGDLTIANSDTAGSVTFDNDEVNVSIGSTPTSGSYPITISGFAPTWTSTAGYIDEYNNIGIVTPPTVSTSSTVAQSTLKNGTTTISSGSTVNPATSEQTINISAGYYPSARTVKIGKSSAGPAGNVTASTNDPGTSYTSKKLTLASGGYLKIDAGYIGNTKISLADLVPDDATITQSTAANYILNGYSAYDNNGVLMTGGINNGTVTPDVTGGTSSGTVSRGKQIKIGAGYYGSDVYYTAQANSGNVTITQKTGQSVDGYETATVQSGTGSVSAGNITPTLEIIDPTTEGGSYTFKTTGSTTVKSTVTKAGWFDTGDVSGASATITANKTLSVANAGKPTADLTTSTNTTTYPSGYSGLAITSHQGYNSSDQIETIAVYQGEYSIA